MRRFVVGIFTLGGLGAVAALASCVGDVPAAADSGADTGVDSGVAPDSGPGFCVLHKSDNGLLLCADFDDGTLGPFTPSVSGKGLVEISSGVAFSPPFAAHLSVQAEPITSAVLLKPFASVMAPVALTITARIKASAGCLPANDLRGLDVMGISAGDPGLGVAANAQGTYPWIRIGKGNWTSWAMPKAAPLATDDWSALKVDVLYTATSGSIVITVDGNVRNPGGISMTPNGPLLVGLGPSSVLGDLDGGAGTGYNGACDVLIDDVLVVNTN